MKDWKVVKGDPTLFEGAPEWATEVATSGSGTVTYEEKLGKVGARWQRIGSDHVHVFTDKNCANSWSLVARRVLAKESKQQQKVHKRRKGVKNPPKTTAKVFIRYKDGTSYTIKNPARVLVTPEETDIVVSELISADGAVVKQDAVFVGNTEIDSITIVALHFVSLLMYPEDLSQGILLIENGNRKVITEAEFNILGNE